MLTTFSWLLFLGHRGKAKVRQAEKLPWGGRKPRQLPRGLHICISDINKTTSTRFYWPRVEIGSSYLAVDSTHTAVGRFRSRVRRSGTRCLTSSQIRRVVLTVLSSFLRQSCLVFTNVTSALEVFLNVMRYIQPRFTYLLTYFPWINTVHACDRELTRLDMMVN